ncbi:MAG: T9SS type A sorting domain-containing protein [Saprospiraceae bacterium]|nr:T9SS type A sorting domain-containing protein [Saprospiraceae bacterium]
MIQVLDPLGRVVYQSMLQTTKGSTQRLDLRHLDKGMYFLNLKMVPISILPKIILRVIWLINFERNLACLIRPRNIVMLESYSIHGQSVSGDEADRFSRRILPG